MRLINPNARDFDELCRKFLWRIPEKFNIATAVCDRHVGGQEGIALFAETINGECHKYTFSQLKELSNQFSNVLKSMGIVAGDRIAIVLPQRVETGICHLAV